jgi:hypothetical protein
MIPMQTPEQVQPEHTSHGNAVIDYAEIRQWLEHGDIQKLAKHYNIDPAHAGKMLSGKVKKLRIDFINDAINKASENKSRIMQAMLKLKRY